MHSLNYTLMTVRSRVRNSRGLSCFNKLRPLWHLLLWGAGFFVLLLLFSEDDGIESIDVIYTTIFIIPIIMGAYLNLYLLIPLLLKRERFLWFALGMALLITGSAGLIFMLFERWIDLILADYYFINYESFPMLMIYSGFFIGIATMLKVTGEWIRLLRADRQQKEVQLKSLRAQVNPHFLLNSLQTMYAQSMEKSEDTPSTILELSEILQYTLYGSAEREVELSREIEVIRKYIRLHELRLDPDRASIQFELEGDPGDLKIAPMLFLPFVENGIKHGIQGSEKETWLRIGLSILPGKLRFSTENNPGTANAGERPLYKGIGIENTRKRLEILYPGRHRLEVTEDDERFKVVLLLDL